MPEPLRLLLDHLDTPIGEMLIVTDGEDTLRAVDWADYEPRMRRLLHIHYGDHGFSLEEAHGSHHPTRAIEQYFAGELAAIDDLLVRTAGTSFQRKVWSALQAIPCGVTISYVELAERVGQPSAVRAVGSANGSNPVGVVVPCHRVIGSNGSLTGYGGGLHRKQWLLQHESRAASRA